MQPAPFVFLPQRGCKRTDTQARQTHWNEHERADKQGLLELGFYRGLYSVWERTLEKYPSVWIEGCVSASRRNCLLPL